MKSRQGKTRAANGEGSFSQYGDGSGRFRMKKQHGYKLSKKEPHIMVPRILTVSGKTRTECIKKMNLKVAEIDKDELNSQKVMRMTLEELCRRHLSYDIANNPSIKQTSLDRREVTIDNQISGTGIGNKQVLSVDESDVQDFINSLLKSKSLSVSTVKKVFYVISGAFKWAIKRKYLNINPCDYIKDDLRQEFKILEQREADDMIVHTLNDTQIKKIVEITQLRNSNNGEIKYPVSIYVMFLRHTGMRVGEFCCLRWQDVIRKENIVLVRINKTRHVSNNRSKNIRGTWEDVTKNSKARIIELNEEAVKYLNLIESICPNHTNDDYVVLNRVNKPTEPTKLIKRINTVYKNAGFPKDISGAHILRRTFATERFKAGESVEMIAAYIGDLPDTVRKHYINKKETLDLGEEGNINYIKKL